MSRFSSRPLITVLLVVASTLIPVRTARSASPQSAAGGPQKPSAFHFDIEEITLKLKDKVLLHDQFQRQGGLKPAEMEGRRLAATEGPEYRVDLGQMSASNIHDGVLTVDQDVTSNIWKGPQGNYGHTLHRYDSFVSMFTLPIDMAGGTILLGREAFGLEFSVRLRRPRLQGFEKLKIGLMDTEGFKSVAAMSVGRLPLPASPPAGSQSSGGPESFNILELVNQPAVVLGRVEEPKVRGEILLAHTNLERFDEIETLEMTLRVGPEGQLSGRVRTYVGGQMKEVELQPKEPSTMPANVRLSATLFVETLPGLEVLHVYPREVAVRDLGSGDKVRFRVEGFGFGPDSRVEIFPEGAQGEPLRADAIHAQRVPGTPEGTVLLADIGLPGRVESYGLRVTTGGQSIVYKNAVRVFASSAAGSRTTPP